MGGLNKQRQQRRSRRVNHFAAVVLSTDIYLPGFGLRSLAWTHNDGVSVLYFMRVKEWAYVMPTAAKNFHKIFPDLVF